ncbi:DUF2218 domain-containing protein [Pseudoruegeria sp. SK021]|uniref:DUF2218 domain-containing protein n=1 Tax=Pseudoruegeria sp. SK021 TaxID=1933035 RepID=UPI000A235BC2|nr:DUF2218 domain-containing protein [Pseudoruegeria sp. SK021]OSP56200.1 2,4-dihydroxyhept-2-ene-1,7-dioic acid aldolase [Pseudoruegeria sp. SK021]
MFTSNAKFTTERASSYLQQLCKHFGHKIEVQFDPQAGLIKFPFGQCALSADQGVLDLTVNAETQADLTKACRVIGSHLERFAFRESPKIEWQAVTAVNSADT